MRDNMIAVPFAPAARAGRIRDRSWSPDFAPPCRARPMATACARSAPQRRLRRSLRPGGVLRLGCPPLACRPRGCNRLPSCLLALRECNGHQVPGHHCWPTSLVVASIICALPLTPQFPFEGEALIALAALPSLARRVVAALSSPRRSPSPVPGWPCRLLAVARGLGCTMSCTGRVGQGARAHQSRPWPARRLSLI